MKLYLVEVKMSGNYKFAYVLDTDCGSAYMRYRDWLDKQNIGYSRDREMESVKLLGESDKLYPDSTRLFL